MDSIDVYEVLVNQHEAMLVAYLLGLVRDPVLAEDLAQEAFVIGFRKLPTLEKKECFPAWLRTIARNLAFQQMRRRHREIPTDRAVIEGMEDVFHPFDQIESDACWAERVRILEICYQQLPDKMREVCRLHYFEDHSTPQITQILQVGLDAVKKRLERSREAIRECMEKRLKLLNV
jgi:RNA polymerase sigma factor (sigma-70 family)